MHLRLHRPRSYTLVVALIGLLLVPSVAFAGLIALVVHTHGNSSNAEAGESGGEIPASALLSVRAARHLSGAPVTSLGASVVHNPAGIALPAGWTLFSNLNHPPGGCLLSPTEFTNWNNGAYTIRVAAFLGNPTCEWLEGDYHYTVHINTGLFEGGALGVLKIPPGAAPAPTAR